MESGKAGRRGGTGRATDKLSTRGTPCARGARMWTGGVWGVGESLAGGVDEQMPLGPSGTEGHLNMEIECVFARWLRHTGDFQPVSEDGGLLISSVKEVIQPQVPLRLP